MAKIKKLVISFIGIFVLGLAILFPMEKVLAVPKPILEDYEKKKGSTWEPKSVPEIPQGEYRITTIIENPEEIPKGQDKSFWYSIKRYKSEAFSYSSDNGKLTFFPERGEQQNFQVINGETQTCIFKKDVYITPYNPSAGKLQIANIGYPMLNYVQNSNKISYKYMAKEPVKTAIEFTAAATTDYHYSLVKIDYGNKNGNTNGAKQGMNAFTYNNNGMAPTITPYNWVEIDETKSKEVKEITLYFKYNPDIKELDLKHKEPDITRQIDYLGDKVPNPDTGLPGGVNDYRVYTSLDTTPISKEDEEKDVLFIMDISNTMSGNSMPGGTRLEVAKKTLKEAVRSVLKSSTTRVSIILFGVKPHILCENKKATKEIESLIDSVKGLGFGVSFGIGTNSGYDMGGTNYRDTFIEAEKLLQRSKNPSVFFLTDGQPEHTYDLFDLTPTPFSYAYAVDSASKIKAERVYSVFIGDSKVSGQASNLQSLAQFFKLNDEKNGEKYMVRAENKTHIENALARFVSSVNNSLNNVIIKDTLSENVTYKEGVKVFKETKNMKTGKTEKTELKKDKDYFVVAKGQNVEITLTQPTEKFTVYTCSYDVQMTEKAFDNFGKNQNKYPDQGDQDTDYKEYQPKNTSSGQEGFFVSEKDASTISYYYMGTTTKKPLPKPVVQLTVIEKPVEITVNKELKSLQGQPLPLQAQMFTFNLHLDSTEKGVIKQAQNDEKGVVKFIIDPLKMVGKTTYIITEVDGGKPGYQYDKSEIKVDLNTTFNPATGEMNSIPTFPNNNHTFTNKYVPEPVEVDITAHKKITSNTGEEIPVKDGEFKFELWDGNQQKKIESNNGQGDIVFKGIRFEQPGKYTLKIKEIPGSDKNFTYDVTVRDVEVDVTDDNGKLKADVKYPANITINNIYSYPETDPVIVMKTILTGQQLLKGRFKYRLEGTGLTTPLEVGNEADGTINFKVPNVDHPGVYEFTAYQVEDVPADPYMNYDIHTKAQPIKVTLTVTAVDGRNLQGNVVFDNTDTFRNHYQLKGNIW